MISQVLCHKLKKQNLHGYSIVPLSCNTCEEAEGNKKQNNAVNA